MAETSGGGVLERGRVRFALAGLVAGGVVMALNGVKQVLVPVFPSRWSQALSDLGLNPAGATASDSGAVVFVGTAIVYGFAIAGVYVGLVPILGRGPVAAVSAAVSVWVIGHVAPMVGYASMGIFQIDLVGLTTGLSLVEFSIAALAAAYLYHRGMSQS